VEKNQDFICPHFFLFFGEPGALEWYEKHKKYYDLVVFEGTPYELNQKIESVEWVYEILRDKAFYFYVINREICTHQQVISKFYKSLGEIKRMYSMSESDDHPNIWQKNSELIYIDPDEIQCNSKPIPTVKEALEMSEEELRWYYIVYHEKEYKYFYEIYINKHSERRIEELIKMKIFHYQISNRLKVFSF